MACVLIASEHKRTLHLNVVYHNLLIFAFGNRLVKLEDYEHNKVNIYLQGSRNDNISVLQKFKQRKKLIQTVLLLMLKESACKYLANITKNTK